MINDTLKSFLTQVALATPMLLAALAAMVVALVRWRRSPRASALVLCATLLSLFSNIGSPLMIWLSPLPDLFSNIVVVISYALDATAFTLLAMGLLFMKSGTPVGFPIYPAMPPPPPPLEWPGNQP